VGEVCDVGLRRGVRGAKTSRGRQGMGIDEREGERGWEVE